MISSAREAEEGLKELKRLREEYNTEHMKVHTLKIFIDGTLKLHTAAMVDPYADIPKAGITAFNKEELADLLKKLNEDMPRFAELGVIANYTPAWHSRDRQGCGFPGI